MVKETVSQRATSTVSAGTAKVSATGEKVDQTERTSKDTQAQDWIARRAYELYEERGRQDGQALEDWVKAERQLVGASSQ